MNELYQSAFYRKFHWNRDVYSTGSDIAFGDGNEKDLNENILKQ